jgi:hypothetical protein
MTGRLDSKKVLLFFGLVLVVSMFPFIGKSEDLMLNVRLNDIIITYGE